MLDRKKDYLYQWEVRWKKPRNYPVDVFDYLQHFTFKYPEYDHEELLALMKTKGRYQLESEELVLTRIPFQYKGIPGQRPNLRDNFFWEFDIPAIQWNRNYKTIIERVLSRGMPSDFDELARFYGRDTVLNVFRNQCHSFWDDMEEEARVYLGLEKEDLLIYHIRKKHHFWSPWNQKTG